MKGFGRGIAGMVLAGALLAQGPPARAAGSGCSAFKWPLAIEQALFSGSSLLESNSGNDIPAVPDTAVALHLAPDTAFTVKPERAPKDANPNGGVLSFKHVDAGTYQITLSDEAWIDMVQEHALVPSGEFSGAVGCPGLRKSVRFVLKNGSMNLQLSSAAVERILLAIRKIQ